MQRLTMSTRTLALSLGAAAALAFAPTVATAASPLDGTAGLEAGGLVEPFGQHGYTTYVCGAPATGVAIRANDSDGATERGRLYNGDHWHVYRTHATEPGIASGWSLGYHYVSPGVNIPGYFKLAYTC